MQCRWQIEKRGEFFIRFIDCEKEATQIVKNVNGLETPFCDRHAKLTMKRSKKYNLGFTVRDISQKDL